MRKILHYDTSKYALLSKRPYASATPAPAATASFPGPTGPFAAITAAHQPVTGAHPAPTASTSLILVSPYIILNWVRNCYYF
jgi:hypothetical protein